ncbi:hypothetical protein ACTA71_007083 [Dictyostelium dimigraforme]
MDNLFRFVFNNKFIRNHIIKFIRILNKDLITKKYNQCNLNWIINYHHYNLLLYKFQKDIKKRNQFTEELFYKFLEGNSEVHILKEIFKIFPQFLPSTTIAENKLIEHCSSLKTSTSLEIIKYITKEFNIKVTKKSIDNACSVNNCKIVKYYLGFNDNEEDRYKGNEININEHCNISTLFCSIRGKDFQLFRLVLESNPNLIDQYQTHDKPIKSLVKTGDVQFITYFCNKQRDGFQFPKLTSYMIKKSPLTIIKYLSTHLKNDLLDLRFLLISIPKRENKNERMEILKLFMEDFKIYERITDESVATLIDLFCECGDLDCIVYLRDIYSTLSTQYNNRFLISSSAIDISIVSGNLHIFHWLFENTNVCCSIYGLKYLCKRISTLKDILDKLLTKFKPIGIISNDMIEVAMFSTNRICQEKENFDYLASFLPTHLIPSFPMETSIEDYDY